MADEPGYVEIEDIREGDVLKKSDLNNTRRSWEDRDYQVGELNIREEGLDRRVFDYDNAWTDALTSSSRCYQTELRNGDNLRPEWVPIGFEKVKGGISNTNARIRFDWDPQKHTYVIFRASFWFRLDVGLMGDAQRTSETDTDVFESLRNNQHVKFGIHVTPPGKDRSGNYYVRKRADEYGRIFCPTQLGLARNYSSDCTGTFADINHKFDRRTAMASSVTMALVGQSWRGDSGLMMENNFQAIDLREAGTVEAQLMWRSREVLRECEIDDSHWEGVQIKPKIGNMNFFAQVFER